ncbi:carbohydrate-binding domain-containing protein [Crenalkalicoccus roseus]|uniref:carbohydrate-binding domain-containing protein n=1 Tax=Crenalkalicoccus roseus TaxID=1485588 RepID=UPI001081DF87|nr:carbohydrate-binding domain-containing protein [Crenalkalicoccus roseus]
MELNVLIRGQSNALLFAQHAGWAAPTAMRKEIEKLLGFDGVTNRVVVHVDWGDSTSTVHSGTSFLKEWMRKDASGQWVAGDLTKSLLGYIAHDMTAAQRANPTAVFWLHSESDSTIHGLSAADWAAAVRADAALVRQALGQSAETVPYMFVSAHPYWGNGAAHQAIRLGMETLAADAGFNGHIAARALDLDIDNDDYDGNPATREYGGSHISASDAMVIAARAARSIAEAFAQYALPDSPMALAGGDIANLGPKVVAARPVGARTLEIDVEHDGAAAFAKLHPDAAKGVGWSVHVPGGKTLYATSATILDGDTLRVTFDGDLPAGGMLHYGYGYGRLASDGGPGQGRAVYDSAGLPIWTPASGVAIAASATTPPPAKGGAVLSAGTGPDALVLQISQDHYLGDAQYLVKVNGQQIGGTFTASATRASGLHDTLTLRGDWGAGTHKVEVVFLNDAWGGSKALDRNLYVEGASFNGQTVAGASLALEREGPASFSITKPAATTPPPAKSGAVLSAGTGPDALVLKISQDHYLGDAQYLVKVNGQQIGGTFTASATKASGLHDTLTLRGDWGAGTHKVEVVFLNDAWGGSKALDRNLYVEGASFNGQAVAGASLALEREGPASFSITKPATTTPPPPQNDGPVTPPAKGEFSTALLWGDEFSGNTVDGSKWPILYGGSMYWNGAFRWDKSQVSVADGNLVISLDKQADGIWNVGGLATIPSWWAPGFSFTYGKVEIRAKASEVVWGAGPCFLLWPASNDHWPPEVDILETPKGRGMFTNHWQGPGGDHDDHYESHLFDLDYSQWHVYTLEWTPSRLTLLVDGQHVKTFTENIPTGPMSIGLQGHVGAAKDEWYGGSPNGSGVDQVQIFVDYVRVYDYIG